MSPLDRLRFWLAEQSVEAALISNPVSVAYLTGFRTDPAERLMALAIGPRRTALILPGLEREAAAAVSEVEIVEWADGEDPIRLAAEVLGLGARLGVEKSHLSLAVAERLREALGERELVDSGREIRRMRAVKSELELGHLARAAAVTDQVTERLFESMAAGQSELEISVRISRLVAEGEAALSFESLVQCGPNSAQPHLRPTGRRLAMGDLVLLDFGASHQGYRADTTRMAVVGEASLRQQEVHRAVLEAHDQALAAIRPGVTSGAIDAAARGVIVKAGLGDHFIHRTGHGLGLEAHEDPSLDPGSEVVLEEGMVVTVEPGVYLPGWGGLRIEDDAVVEAGGARLLTRAERSLRIIRAAGGGASGC